MQEGASRSRPLTSTDLMPAMTRIEDKKLIVAAQMGSVRAFRRLVFEYDAEILALAIRIAASQQEARHLYRDTMLKVHEELPAFRFECAFHIWICRRFIAVSSDYLKRQRAERQDTIHAALHALTPRERIIVELKHYHWESLENIAAMLA